MRSLYKITSLIILLIFFAILLFFLLQKSPKNLDGSRIKIVDNIGKNYFLRGSNPFVEKFGEKNFSYHDLKKYINKTLESEGKEPLKDFYLIDVSLLNLDSYFQILNEQLFFKKYPQLGEVKNFSQIAPELLLMGRSSNQLIYNITKNYHQELDEMLYEIHQNLQQQLDKPVIIYVHCNAGRDRTGAVSASYRMLYKNFNLRQAVRQNVEDVGRNAESFLNDAIKSYCLYLQKERGKAENFCEI